jgi:signal transduction histidine kinase
MPLQVVDAGFFDALLSALTSQLVVIDSAAVVVYTSPSWKETANQRGAAPDRVGIGTSYLEICRVAAAEPSARAAMDGILAVIDGRLTSFAAEYPCAEPDDVRWFAMSVRPLTMAPGFVVVEHTDITPRKQTEQRIREAEARKLELLTELHQAQCANSLHLASRLLAHELRQPLASLVVAGEATLSRPRLEESEVRQTLGDIVALGGALERSLASFEHRLRPRATQLTTFALDRCLLEVSRLIHHEADRRGIQLDLQLDPELPPVSGDRIQVQQAVWHLLMNAIEAVSTGDPRSARLVTLRTARADDGTVAIAVTDSGPPCDDARLHGMAEAFYTTRPHGVGFGLTTCRAMAEAHGSALRVIRNEKRGVTVSFQLRVVDG